MKLFSWLAFVILLNFIFSWATNLPQNLGNDVPAGKLNSLSFAPFREGQNPMLGIFPSEKQLEDDLALMGQVTHNIRTYASAEGNMSLIPDLAKKHGLTMLQGGWLGAIKVTNDAEMDALIKSANEHPDVVKRVIVGNEVLLRGDLKPDELIAYIRKVKQAIKQPVSYADVWSMYMKYPELIKEVDFITIHILPYWEDEPISVADAPSHIERIYKQVQEEANAIAPNKPILIGESGWPSGGKQRGWAIPSVVNEAKFIRDFIQVANKNGFDYNIVEAFNQSWKSELEGIVGAKWGLYNNSRQQIFPLTGAVVENSDWFKFAVCAALVFIGISLLFKMQLSKLNTMRLLNFLIIAQFISILFISQATTLWQTSYTDFQRLQTIFITSFNAIFAYFLLQRIVDLLIEKISGVNLSARIYNCLLILVSYSVIKTFVLAVDGRYVIFPISATQTLIFAVLALAYINKFLNKKSAVESVNLLGLFGIAFSDLTTAKRMGYSLFGLILVLIVGESYAFLVGRDFIAAYPSMINRIGMAVLFTITNQQLLIWVASLAILSIPFCVSGKINQSHL